jgi:hypothetical protein
MQKQARRDTTPPRHRSALSAAQTAWEDERRELCAKAVAQHLKQAVNLQRPIASLSRAELIGVAFAATSEFIRVTSARLAAPSPETDLTADAHLLGVL